MQCFLHLKAGIILFTTFLLIIGNASSQELIPVTLEEKINGSFSVVLGKIVQQQAFTGTDHNIYTINKVAVSAYIKSPVPVEIYINTPGGIVGNRATVVNPSIQLEKGNAPCG